MLCSTFDASVEGDSLCDSFTPLVEPLLALLPSPLASARAQNLFVRLTTAIMPGKLNLLGKLLELFSFSACVAMVMQWCLFLSLERPYGR